MRRRERQRGYTLIEVLIAGLIMTVLGMGLWTLLRSTYDSQYEVLGQNTANAYARQAVDELADKLRGAKALSAASASDITFTDNSNNAIRYYRSGGNLVKTTNGGASTVVVMSITSLTFTYWTYSNSAWTSSSAPTTPANVGAVDFSVTATVSGSTRQISGSVRIRQK